MNVTLENISLEDLTPKELELLGSEQGVRFVRFRNAVLARAERNKNQDRITPEGIQELAATLPNTAIDDEHKKQVVTGFFTEAAAVEENGTVALSTGGILHADRYPVEVTQVLHGERLLSIEASAEKAECSVCHQSFTAETQYCNHLQSRLIDRAAERILSGLTAKGGAITRHPAGTDTRFDLNHVELLASVKGELEPVLSFPSELLYELWLRQPDLVAKVLSAEDRRRLPASDYAVRQKQDSKTVERFPLNDCEHARKALQLLPQAKNLSEEERSRIKARAHAKLEKCGSEAKGAERAASLLYAAFANDPSPVYPGQVVYRPVFSPIMFVENPEWVARLAKPVGKPAKPTVTASEQKEEKLIEGAPSPASVTGFSLESPQPNTPLKMEW